MSRETSDGLVCLMSDDLRHEISNWDAGYVLGYVYRSWDSIKDSSWSKDGIDALDIDEFVCTLMHVDREILCGGEV